MQRFFIVLVLIAISVGSLGAVEVGAIDSGLHPYLSALGEIEGQRQVGQEIFFTASLSTDHATSCASCHKPEFAFTDRGRHSLGAHAQVATRNAPSLLDAGRNLSFFWDGRSSSLELSVLNPLTNPREHGFDSKEALMDAVWADAALIQRIAFVLGIGQGQIQSEHVAGLLARYVEGLVSAESAFDRYQSGRADAAFTAEAERGYHLFVGEARCNACHIVRMDRATFTDHEFHFAATGLNHAQSNLPELTNRLVERRRRGEPVDHSVVNDAELAALGRFVVTLQPADIGKFKTPSLRNVAVTAPYMHDGSVATLEEAVEQEVYYRGQQAGHVSILSPQEKADLVAFLKSLTSPPYVNP